MKKPVIVDARVLAGSGGGPDKTLINSPPYLERAGYQMYCVYLHHPEDTGFQSLQKKAAAKGVELLSVPDFGAADWRVLPRLVQLCRKLRADVWHGHDYKTNTLGLILKRMLPIRLVTTLHGWVHQTSKTPLYYFLDRLSLRFYEKVFSVSIDLDQAASRAGVPKSRRVLLENGINLKEFQRRQSAAQARQSLGFPERLTIGAAGRLSAEKGFDRLIQACSDLVRRGHDVQLLIAGEGEEHAHLAELIHTLGHTDRFHLLGYRSDLRQIYEAMDIYALSSYREGLPNVLLEAMALEIPVVATAVNGVPHLLDYGEAGILVPAGDTYELRKGLEFLLQNPHYAEHLKQRGLQTIRIRYDFELRMKKLVDVYEEMGLRREGH